MAESPVWVSQLKLIRDEFTQWANQRPGLQHILVLPLSPEMRCLPECLEKEIGANLNAIRKSDPWEFVLEGKNATTENGWLYGPLKELNAFTELAARAWITIPTGNSQLPEEEQCDEWLYLVYRMLREHLPSYFRDDRRLQLVSGVGRMLGKEIIWVQPASR
jgi:hypothetical protein